MRYRVLLFVSRVIMSIGLLFMGINKFIFEMSDIYIRIIGIVIAVNLVLFSYSCSGIKQQKIHKNI